MCVAPTLEEQKILQMDWTCKKCKAKGSITYPLGTLPALITELLMTSHEEETKAECGYSHDDIKVSHAREVPPNEE